MITLEEIKKQIEICRKCDLWAKRNKPVVGEGPPTAKIMVVGLGPGYHENLQGRPFVGPAGKLLDKLLALVGLKRDEIYITNVIKCYLPDNTPTKDEIKACGPYLDMQIEVIKPKVIIALGNVAIQYLFEKFGLKYYPISKIHGRIFAVDNLKYHLKLIPMYHPAAALRNPRLLETVQADWLKMKPYLDHL